SFGSDAFSTDVNSTGAIAPIFLKNPVLGGSKVNESVLDLGAIKIPSLGASGPTISPFYFRSPNRWNWDISLFKNFKISESKNLQFRTGFFNIFNQAYPKRTDVGNASNSDINLTLNTTCVRTPTNITLVLPDGTVRTGDTAFSQTFANGNGGTSSGICD